MDIDIDFKTDFKPNTVFKQAVPASMIKDNTLSKHPCGQYFQNIDIDNVTQLSAIPFEEAEVLGYFKIDFLHLSVLDQCTSKQQIRQLISSEPDWNLLLEPNVVDQLFQLRKHYDTLIKIKPKNVQELADTIALIRPGKRHLIPDYIANKTKIREQLYKKFDDGYAFKRSHAISYALTIVLQLHMIAQQL